jgi:two-component system, chemotaxis family, sensor kinase CheA
MTPDLTYFKQKFLDEASDLLIKLDNILLDLETTNNPKSTDEVFRIMHTIKGTGGMYGFDLIVEVAHELETLYNLIREQKITISSTIIELTLEASEHIRSLLVEGNEEIKEIEYRQHSLIQRISTISGVPAEKKETTETKEEENIATNWIIQFQPKEEHIKRCINLSYVLEDLALLGKCRVEKKCIEENPVEVWEIHLSTTKSYSDIEEVLIFILDDCKITKEENPGQNIPDAPKSDFSCEQKNSEQSDIYSSKSQDIIKKFESRQSSSIRVDTSKLDTLMYLVSELVTTKSELIIATQQKDEAKLIEASEKIEKLSKQFSDNALSIRLVPLNEMLSRFKRLVHDLAKQLGKKVDFVITGEDTELDKSIIAAIGEPIMHLIRNNIDHGIESPEKRIEKGKKETGILTFEAYKSGNYVYINIGDDGNGIDCDYVLNKAIEKGFISEQSHLSEKEILDLIFLPGFSTAQCLSEVSGRGMGMDIVLKKIKDIRGEISVSTEKGKGTTISLKLQQTVSIIDTLLVKADHYIYAIPLEEIDSCSLCPTSSLLEKHNDLLVIGKELTPYINLCGEITVKSDKDQKKLVLLNKYNHKFALVVDDIIGEYQSVIKPLGDAFKDINFLSGASLLGDGSIALLIDTEKLRQGIVSK